MASLVLAQVWRIVTASMSHVDLIHLGMNMASLYQVGWLEEMYGSVLYLYFSLVLVILTMIVSLVIYHILIRKFGKVRPRALVTGASLGFTPHRRSRDRSFSYCLSASAAGPLTGALHRDHRRGLLLRPVRPRRRVDVENPGVLPPAGPEARVPADVAAAGAVPSGHDAAVQRRALPPPRRHALPGAPRVVRGPPVRHRHGLPARVGRPELVQPAGAGAALRRGGPVPSVGLCRCRWPRRRCVAGPWVVVGWRGQWRWSLVHRDNGTRPGVAVVTTASWWRSIPSPADDRPADGCCYRGAADGQLMVRGADVMQVNGEWRAVCICFVLAAAVHVVARCACCVAVLTGP